ncbi:uncharacterized protein PV09_07573 [Verruconis gallopava]|uniref:Barwin domain-containing protein n=1 Tax=Verruconis gallopava TaxID=253628 RepID=A0A0D2APJ2_9PEZI|nr:uncharacterized protein PV09_07573 [Verruconis gallopava]KIW01059.1 hypothetical protein PV09_07573 [Verruconis gallopava]
MQFATVFVTLAIAAVSSALPVSEANKASANLERRQASGKATYYNTMYPTYSSCGDQPQDTDMIAALAPSFMPAACGKNIAVTNEETGTTITVTVVDTCVACAGGSVAVDLSPSAFEAAGATLDAGTFTTSWTFV